MSHYLNDLRNNEMLTAIDAIDGEEYNDRPVLTQLLKVTGEDKK